MSSTPFQSVRFSRDGRVLSDVRDPDDLLRYVASASFDLVIAERSDDGDQPEQLGRDHDYGTAAQAAELDDDLYVFEIFAGDNRESTVLPSAAAVVEAFVSWAEESPGWRDQYSWDES